MRYTLKILKIEQCADRVKTFSLEKPNNLKFLPGHCCMLSLPKEKLEKESRPFTFTSIPSDTYLEFTIKSYPGGITELIHSLKVGDSLVLADIFSSHRYTKPGVFIAAGTGITPFLSIFRQLKKDNSNDKNLLIYTNNTQKDIIRENELKSLLNNNCIFKLTKENKPGYLSERIDKSFLLKHITNFNQQFYVCGPEQFEKEIKSIIKEIKEEKGL